MSDGVWPTQIDLKLVKRASSTQGMALFAVIRDEDYFLPHFFAHYRALGVDTFLIYDDRSGEAAKAFLHAQPDCSIAVSEHRYGDIFGATGGNIIRRLPTALREAAPVTFFPDRWVLTADADEFLVLPSGYQTLGEMTARLDGLGQPYLSAPMIDFYGATLNHRHHAPELSPFEGSPYFDAGPHFRWDEGSALPEPLRAGVRYRLHEMLLLKHRETYLAIHGDTVSLPQNWKSPLLKNGAGVRRVGDHALNLIPDTRITGALAHFKFTPGLDEKIAVAVAEAQYTLGSRHYHFLEAACRLLGDAPLTCEATRRFEGAGSLEGAGLMGDSLPA
ncbi:MAG TPA: glycosyltransferase family 2 protein [Caulobacteraceae bacterium]|jgi:hypothetical protein